MIGKKIFLWLCSTTLSAVVFFFICTSCFAANCPYCNSVMLQQGYTEHEESGTHRAEYSENGVLKDEDCNFNKRTDYVGYVCTNGHGAISSRHHYMESHSSSHHSNLNMDYWY